MATKTTGAQNQGTQKKKNRLNTYQQISAFSVEEGTSMLHRQGETRECIERNVVCTQIAVDMKCTLYMVRAGDMAELF